MSISREQMRELADFKDQKSCAVSFYFQPSTPRNKAHKEDTILIKDLAREAIRSLETKSEKECARADIERITRLSAELRSNGTHAKAVFACADQKIWREYDLPPTLGSTSTLRRSAFSHQAPRAPARSFAAIGRGACRPASSPHLRSSPWRID